jgi:hypothetical protein
MSRATVRAGIAAYLAPPAVTGINTVYTSYPKIIPAAAFFASSAIGAGGGAALVVHIVASPEMRKTSPAVAGGWKRVDHEVELNLFHRWVAPSQTVGGDAMIDAMANFDAVIDALKVKIRADPTCGGALWQWGQEIDGRFGDPDLTANGVETWGALTLTASEWFQA